MPLVAKLETFDGKAISISLPKGEVEPWELRFHILAGGLTSTSSCIFVKLACLQSVQLSKNGTNSEGRTSDGHN